MMSNDEYLNLVKREAQKTDCFKNSVVAFFIGGTICLLGECLFNIFKSFGQSEDLSRVLVSISLIVLSAILTGLHVYDKIAKVAGAGTLVPITGFANAVVSPAMEFKSEGLIVGLGSKMFIVAGPVLVYGVSASIIYGVVAFIFHLY